MIEMMVVGVVVTVALVWAGRAIWRSVRKGSGCSSCADGDNCPLTRNPELLEELTRKGVEACHTGGSCRDLLESVRDQDAD